MFKTTNVVFTPPLEPIEKRPREGLDPESDEMPQESPVLQRQNAGEPIYKLKDESSS